MYLYSTRTCEHKTSTTPRPDLFPGYQDALGRLGVHRTFFSPLCFEREPPTTEPLRDPTPFQSLHGDCLLLGPIPPPLLVGTLPPPEQPRSPSLWPPSFAQGGGSPCRSTVFPDPASTPSAYLSSLGPEAIRLQRLYKMCLVIVCFFLISLSCIFRGRGPEPRREIKKKKTTQEKDFGCEGGKGEGASCP